MFPTYQDVVNLSAGLVVLTIWAVCDESAKSLFEHGVRNYHVHVTSKLQYPFPLPVTSIVTPAPMDSLLAIGIFANMAIKIPCYDNELLHVHFCNCFSELVVETVLLVIV